MHYLKLETHHQQHGWVFPVEAKMAFEYNTGYNVMSVELFAAFQTKPLLPSNSHTLSRKYSMKIFENFGLSPV